MSAFYKNWWLLLLASISLFLTLSITQPVDISLRSTQHLWNLGHLALFFIISCCIYYFRNQQLKSLHNEIIELIAYPFIFGLSIELIQPWFERTTDIDDLIKNLTGSLLAFCLLSQHLALNSKKKQLLLSSLSLVLGFYALIPFTTSYYDEAMAKNNFPIIIDFESPLELSRLSPIGKNTTIAIIKRDKDTHALALSIQKEEYSGASISYLSRNWQNYNQLLFNVYNPLKKTQPLILKIYDNQHHYNNYDYNDRY
ncbi:MAG: glycopeptide antibiotics resistance protein, partial [Pseudohongiellaceae bacterium]